MTGASTQRMQEGWVSQAACTSPTIVVAVTAAGAAAQRWWDPAMDATVRYPYTSVTEMNRPSRQAERGDITAQLVQLLPELAVTLYEAGPHEEARSHAHGERLTGRQMKAVMFLAHHGTVTMGELAEGLEIGRAAASELVARLTEKKVAVRKDDPHDRRVVLVGLVGRAEGYADTLLAQWRDRLEAAFALYPDLDPDTLVAFLRTLIKQLKGRSGP
jgi:DNA-binding MarR family transcriptional regulator